MQVVLKSEDGKEYWRGSLKEFLYNNNFYPNEEKKILDDLKSQGYTVGGGGASPVWKLERFEGDIEDIRRRAGIATKDYPVDLNETEWAINQRLSPGARRIYQEVLDAMQNAEEMGGVEDTQEYRVLMYALAAEATKRAKTSSQKGNS